jgi:hypothetical protein
MWILKGFITMCMLCLGLFIGLLFPVIGIIGLFCMGVWFFGMFS